MAETAGAKVMVFIARSEVAAAKQEPHTAISWASSRGRMAFIISHLLVRYICHLLTELNQNPGGQEDKEL